MVHSKVIENNIGTKLETASYASAILVISLGRVFVSNVLFFYNSAGGALNFACSNGEICNCVFQGNSGDAGGAIVTDIHTSLVVITNTTFLENKGGSSADLYFHNRHILIQSCFFRETGSTPPVALANTENMQVRLYNNVFTWPSPQPITKPKPIVTTQKPFTPLVHFQPLVATTIYMWKTSYQEFRKYELLPVDQSGFYNQTKAKTSFTTNSIPNVTQVFSQYASSKFTFQVK